MGQQSKLYLYDAQDLAWLFIAQGLREEINPHGVQLPPPEAQRKHMFLPQIGKPGLEQVIASLTQIRDCCEPNSCPSTIPVK